MLGDHSAGGLSPEGWARRVADAAGWWNAGHIVAEGNQGGEMVGSVLRAAGVRLPVRIVHARVGKARRAEPVVAAFDRGEATLPGSFRARRIVKDGPVNIVKAPLNEMWQRGRTSAMGGKPGLRRTRRPFKSSP